MVLHVYPQVRLFTTVSDLNINIKFTLRMNDRMKTIMKAEDVGRER